MNQTFFSTACGGEFSDILKIRRGNGLNDLTWVFVFERAQLFAREQLEFPFKLHTTDRDRLLAVTVSPLLSMRLNSNVRNRRRY